MIFTFKELVLYLYVFLFIIFNITYFNSSETLLSTTLFYHANIFYFLVLFLTLIIRNKDQLLLLIPLYYSIYFGQRLIFLLVEEPMLRYFFLNHYDFHKAIIFINFTIVILILCTTILRLFEKSIKINLQEILNNQTNRNIFHYLFIIILLLSIGFRLLQYDPVLSKAWIFDQLLLPFIYIIEYLDLFIFITFAIFLMRNKLSCSRSERILLNISLILILIRIIITFTKGFIISPFLIILTIWLLVSEKPRIFKLSYMLGISFIVGITLFSVDIQLSAMKKFKNLNVTTEYSKLEITHPHETKLSNFIDSQILNISKFSRRIGGLDWVALGFSKESKKIRHKQINDISLFDAVTLEKEIQRIYNRFVLDEYRYKVMNPAHLITQLTRGYPAEFEVRHGEDLSFFTLLVLLFEWQGLIYFTILVLLFYYFLSSNVNLIFKSFFCYYIIFELMPGGSLSETIKDTVLLLIYYYLFINILIPTLKLIFQNMGKSKQGT